MLISRKHNFIFIHIYKNAGTSITNALMPFAISSFQQKVNVMMSVILKGWGQTKLNTILMKLFPWVNPQPYLEHIGASELISNMGRDVFKSYFSFAIVRNPWDWQVSLYTYMLKEITHPQHEFIKGLRGFDDYIKWRCSEEVRYQKDFIFSEDGELLVNFVGQFERLERDFDSICSQIGISTFLPKLNVSNTKSYQDYYNVETIELVKRTFEPDIRLFDYDFE